MSDNDNEHDNVLRNLVSATSLERASAKAPGFRPEILPGPFDIGGFTDVTFWLMQRGPVAAPASDIMGAVGMMLCRIRDMGFVLQKLWDSFDELDEPAYKHLDAEQIVDEVARRLEAWSDDPETKSYLAEANEISQALKFVNVTNKGQTPQ